jgi:hypothetical protein
MRRALIAALALLSLAACAGSASSSDASRALPLVRPQLNSNLYVADQGLNAVVELDSQGNKVAEKSFGPKPLDVVTDSRGNVYLLTAEFVVHELTHNLGRVIRQYSPNSYLSVALAIDANDNLYVQGWNYARGAFVARYAYGSSKIEKVYKMPFSISGGAKVGGISVRGTRLFFAVDSNFTVPKTTLWACSLAGTSCKRLQPVGIDSLYGCGFTTTRRFAVYGAGAAAYAFHPYSAWQFSQGSKISLPTGYFFGNDNGFCNLHNYGIFVWGTMKTSQASRPAEAVELDTSQDNVAATVGGGVLSVPVAAYYGNGFTP